MIVSARRWAWQRAAAFCATARLRGLCRAGVFPRRGAWRRRGAFRDDASTAAPQAAFRSAKYEVPALSAEIVPLRRQDKVLPGFAGYLRRKAAMHPSVCTLRRIHLPLQGRLYKRLSPKRLPCKGSCRRPPTEGCGALPCQYPSGSPQGPPAGVNARPTIYGKRAANPEKRLSAAFLRWVNAAPSASSPAHTPQFSPRRFLQ